MFAPFYSVYQKGNKLFVTINGLPIDGVFEERVKNSFKEYLVKKHWVLSSEEASKVAAPEDFISKEMAQDLERAVKAGINKVYQLAATQQGTNYYLRLVNLPPMFFGGSQTPQRKLGDEQIAYIGINSKQSRVGTITPPKRKR